MLRISWIAERSGVGTLVRSTRCFSGRPVGSWPLKELGKTPYREYIDLIFYLIRNGTHLIKVSRDIHNFLFLNFIIFNCGLFLYNVTTRFLLKKQWKKF